MCPLRQLIPAAGLHRGSWWGLSVAKLESSMLPQMVTPTQLLLRCIPLQSRATADVLAKKTSLPPTDC